MEKKIDHTNKTKNTKALTQREKQKRKNDRVTKIFLISILILFVIYVFGFVIAMLNREKTPSTTVEIGSIDLPDFIEGVIIRDETVYKANASGQITYFYNDLEKIKAGSTVANITSVENLDQLKKEISKIDEDILKLQKIRGDDLSLAQKDAKKINKNIKNNVDESIMDFANDDISHVYGMKDDIEKKVNLRNRLLIEETQTSTNDERTYAYNELKNKENNIDIEDSGIISYYFDGLEDMLNIESMYALVEEQVTEKGNDKEFTPASSLIDEGDGIFKIVNSNDWYIGTYVENDKIVDWDKGSKRNIYIENGNEYDKIEVIIESIGKLSDDNSPRDIVNKDKKTFVLFKAKRNMLDYIENRYIKFKTSQNENIGLKIPNTSIVEETILTIPKEYLSGERKNLVKIKGSDGEVKDVFVIVKENASLYTDIKENAILLRKFGSVELGDTIIHPTKNTEFKIEEFQVIYGVYRINSGIAKFIDIVLDDKKDLLKEYIILDTYLNQNLKSHDFIATYGDEINEGQKVYKK